MLTLSRYLLYLYPAAHRMEFGEEMSEVLRERQNEIGKRGALARWISNGREIGGLLRGAVREHVRAATGLYSWEGFTIRRIRMRTEFRFPKATPVLMTVILGAVVMAIEKATLFPSSTGLGPVLTTVSVGENPKSRAVMSTPATVTAYVSTVVSW